MGKEVPFYPNLKCEECGAMGAYSFAWNGEWCQACLDKDPPGDDESDGDKDAA